MKIMIQALAGSFFIHIVYFLSSFIIGYIKTIFYQPDISGTYNTVETLQNEVAFGGVVIHPFLFISSFFGMAIICGVLIIFLKKVMIKQN
ncbi:hypothetical protein QYG89_14655 [Bacillus sp. B190/17]|uniref:DUF4306 domain-containing protein n=1 Tax=Bacillus lumedeiriae TaxID=3058829 RepID=A0ABW8IBK8_9BACI